MLIDGQYAAALAPAPFFAETPGLKWVILFGRVYEAKMPHRREDGYFDHGHPDWVDDLHVVTLEGRPLHVPGLFRRHCEQIFIEHLRAAGELIESYA